MKKHLGSTMAIILGVFFICVGVTAIINDDPARGRMAVQGGIAVILGALAYRSAKKRKLHKVEFTPSRRAMELLALALCCMIANMGTEVVWILIIIPFWALAAYFIISPGKTPTKLAPDRSPRSQSPRIG